MTNKTPKFTLEGNREDFTEAVKTLGMVNSLLSSLAFAEDYLHNGHYNGLANSIEQIKKAATIRKPRTAVGDGR